MAAESPTHLELEIGHVLFIDIVGYSKLLSDNRDLACRGRGPLTDDSREVREWLSMTTSLIRRLIDHRVFAAAAGASLLLAGNVFAQDLVSCHVASPPPEQAGAGTTAEVERVIVTGSNIPSAEETGPNPVDTYRAEDIQKLGAHNATDLITKLPQEMGSTVNQNIANGGDGSVIPNLRGLLPKETLVLIDGKRAAIIGGGGAAGPGRPGWTSISFLSQ